MTVAQLTPQQAQQLKGIEFATDSFFNPILDKNGNYIISLEEVDQCDIEWVKLLLLIEFEPTHPEL
jgi:hypothetical protein